MAISTLIKYEGDNSTFIWKYPKEDFNCLTQIIVHESQEAIFVKDGTIMDVLGPGRYKLDAENIPLLSHALNRITGISIIHCEVYYINKTIQMGMFWGTDEKIRFIEPTLNVPVEIGASGELQMQVCDSVALLVKVVGTMNGISWEKRGQEFTRSVQNSFRPIISNAVKTTLPIVIKQEAIDIVDIDERLDLLSAAMHAAVHKGFIDYGLDVVKFFVTTIVLPENDPNYKKLKELHTVSLQKKEAEAEAEIESAKAASKARITAAQREIELERQKTETEVLKREAERKVIAAEAEAEVLRKTGMAEAEVMQAQGYNKKDVLQAEVQKAYAEGLGHMGNGTSGGSSGVMGDMVGLGVGMAAASAITKPVKEMFAGMDSEKETVKSDTVKCPKCGNVLPANAKFCLECGTKIENILQNEIICPHCGKKTPKGKFCIECGGTLINICPKCGATVPTGGKFCLECGTKLQ